MYGLLDPKPDQPGAGELVARTVHMNSTASMQ
jgi:hypothetical protein